MLNSKLIAAVVVVALAGTGAAVLFLNNDSTDDSTSPGIMLSFDFNGGTKVLDNIRFEDDSEVKTIPSSIPSKEGAEFKEWNTLKSGEGTAYTPGSSLSISVDTVLYAIYVSEITYNSNGGTGNMEGITVTTDSSAPVDDNTFKYTWHTFICWNTHADGSGTDYYPGENFVLTSNQTLYAKWTDWTILNAQVGTTFTYNVNGELINPEQYDWVNSAVAAANTYAGKLGISVSIDGATFKGRYVQEITEINDTGVTYSRSGNVNVTIHFTVTVPIIGDKQLSASVENVAIGQDGKLSLDGVLLCTIDALRESAGDVYEVYENTDFGGLQVKKVNIGNATLFIDKNTMIVAKVDYSECGKYSFTAALAETNVAW